MSALGTSLATRKMVYRILDQYKDAPKWVAFIQSVGKLFDDTDAIIEHLLFGRFMDTAVGFELDRIGTILGYPRPYIEDTENIFTYRSYLDINVQSKGFGTVSDPAVGGKYTSAYGLTSDIQLDDDAYRALLFIRSRVMSLGPSIPELYQWITEWFGVDVAITVPLVLNINIEITSGSLTAYQRRLIENFGPTLPGVAVLITNWS